MALTYAASRGFRMSGLLEKGDSCVFFAAESGFTIDVLETAARLEIEVKGCVTIDKPNWDLGGLTPYPADAIPPWFFEENYIVTHNIPAIRKQRLLQCEALGFHRLTSLFDPTAILPRSISFAPGCYINAGAVLGGQCSLGRAVFINRRVAVGHHSILDDYVSIGPGAVLASRVHVGAGTMIGSGATIAPGMSIGPNSVVTVGAVVHKDVASNTIVAGNPARTVKSGIAGYRGAGV